MGVKGTEKQHMRISANARLAMKMLVGFCMERFLRTTNATRMFPNVPMMKMRL
jgi:hypothetical protein